MKPSEVAAALIADFAKKIVEKNKRIVELEEAIRSHRNAKADDRCWIDDQDLYSVLGDGDLGDNTIPDPEKMLENCKRFIAVRCAGGSWKTYQELEAELAKKDKLIAELRSDYARGKFNIP